MPDAGILRTSAPSAPARRRRASPETVRIRRRAPHGVHTFPIPRVVSDGDTVRGEDARLAGIAAWSLAHGFATLLLSGNLSDALEGRTPEEAFRTAAGLIFTTNHPDS